VRDALKIKETISPTYCYCGAGFYKGIWEEILQKPVEVKLLESVLKVV
jgi:predicted hydrocarbon binding protein